MLNTQYEKCQNAKLIDLISMPLQDVKPWLEQKPMWMQKQIEKAILDNSEVKK